MLFNSGVFLFAFLPLTLLVFYVCGRFRQTRLAILCLVFASLVYYGWWNPVYLPLILGSMLANFFIGITIKSSLESEGGLTRTLLTVGIGLNLGLLAYFKYANFFVENINAATGSEFQLTPVILPLAISFFTFQQIAYLVDVYQGKAKEVDLLRYALFVTFFPQLIAGPIVHHKEMMPQFEGLKVGRFKLSNLVVGLSIFFLGLFKKIVFADNVAPYANTVFNGAMVGAEIGFADAWVGALAYTCQIYFDFSGYSDMAIGLARMFGINLPLNFNSPYKATGIAEFWRRWHMTLSRFLRDYLYIPLGGNRLGAQRRYTNMIVVMLLGGLWHGAGWNFVIWGGLHGLYLGINHAWQSWRGDVPESSFLAKTAGQILTFVAVVVAWVFFRAESFPAAWSVITSMASFGELANGITLARTDTKAVAWISLLLSIVWLAPNTQQFMRNYMDSNSYQIVQPTRLQMWCTWQPRALFAFALAAVSAVTIMSLWQPSEFIYYQF